MSESNLYRRGETWYARVVANGREHRRSLRTSSRAEAKKRLKVFMEQVEHMRFYGDRRPSWKDAVVAWAAAATGAIKPGVMKRYLVSIGRARPVLDGLYVDEINKVSMAKIANREGIKNATKRRDLSAISSVLRYCVAQGWREDNPARDFDRSIIREKRDPIEPPSDADIAAFCKNAPPMVAQLTRFLLYTGMRQEEAVSLEWSQVDFVTKRITIYRTKSNRPRTIRLDDLITPKAAAILEKLPRHVACPYVFWHQPGERYRNFASRFAYIVKRAGVKFRCHDLRHRFAIDYLKAGGDIYRLSRHLGHSSVKTTEIYLGHVGERDGTESGTQERAETA